MHQLPTLPSSSDRAETKRFKLIGTKHKEELHYYFLEGKFVWGFVSFFVFILCGFCSVFFSTLEYSICPDSHHFTPQFPPLLKILEGILTLQFCSKGIYKLKNTYFHSYWHGKNTWFLLHPGNWNKRVSWGVTAQQPCKRQQEIIYFSFIPPVLPLLFLHYFHSCSFIYFPFTMSLVQV